MSIADGHPPDSAHSYMEARQRKLRQTLETCGILTRDGLFEAAHAESWHVPFDVALQRAVRSGRVQKLTGDLFKAGTRT